MFGLIGFPLGYILLKMNGVCGLRGWQWLFLMEGMPSIILGIVTFRTLPDKPSHAKWLTGDEKAWLAETMQRDALRHEQVEHLTLRTVFREPRVMQLALIFLITAIGGNMVGPFGPQLLKERSHGLWSNSFIALIGIIPAIVGAIAMTVASVHSDRTGKRRAHIVTGYLTAGVAFIAMVYAPGAWWVVAAMCLNAFGERIAAGSYWAVTANTLGLRAAAGGIAMINSVGNLGGFFGPRLMAEMKTRTHGSYEPGLFTAAGLVVTGAIISLLLPKPPTKTANVQDAAVAEVEVALATVETP
jgi:ACS family tartrate transporter-like MFS transporter